MIAILVRNDTGEAISIVSSDAHSPEVWGPGEERPVLLDGNRGILRLAVSKLENARIIR